MEGVDVRRLISQSAEYLELKKDGNSLPRPSLNLNTSDKYSSFLNSFFYREKIEAPVFAADKPLTCFLGYTSLVERQKRQADVNLKTTIIKKSLCCCMNFFDCPSLCSANRGL